SDINMLVASDLSENSLDLLRVAIGKGQVSNAKIHVLHAVERPSAGWIFNRKTPEEIDAQMQARRDQADQKLKAQLSQTDWRTVSGGVKLHVVDGPAPEAILKAIEE